MIFNREMGECVPGPGYFGALHGVVLRSSSTQDSIIRVIRFAGTHCHILRPDNPDSIGGVRTQQDQGSARCLDTDYRSCSHGEFP